jgi:DNA-binding transcriptional LysR family regulator
MTKSLDDLVSFAIFARVVEARSFTAAAARLGVSKSIVSKRVAALEARLGVQLLHRTTRRLSLTAEGARLHEHCLPMLRAVDDAPALVQGAGSEPRGVLRVSCPVVLTDTYLAEAIAAFVRRHPQVQVDLTGENTMVDLIGDRVDVAIRMSSQLASSSLVARRIGTAPKIVCAAPEYLAERGRPRTPDDLRSHACLRFAPLRPDVEWRFQVGRSAVVVPVSGPLIADNAEALRRAAVAGAGVIVLPDFMLAGDLAAGRLVPLLEAYPVNALGVFAVHASGRFVPAKVRRFVDHVAAWLRAVPLGARLRSK